MNDVKMLSQEDFEGGTKAIFEVDGVKYYVTVFEEETQFRVVVTIDKEDKKKYSRAIALTLADFMFMEGEDEQ